MGSNSTSSTETVKSGLGSVNGNFSQDSLEEDEPTPRNEKNGSPQPDEIQGHELVPSDRAQKRTCGLEGSDSEADLERELYFLQQQLIVATRWADAAKTRGSWIDPTKVVKSWSAELAGNFRGNDKVKFSYENILSPSLVPIRETSTYIEICSDASDVTASLPEPVESSIKFLDRVRHSSTHEKFSPRPVRKMLSHDQRALSINSSIPTRQPHQTHRRSSSLSRDFRGGCVGGGAGAVGVTSMWIPVTSDPSPRRFFPPTSPTPSQTSFCSLPSSSGLWSGHFSRISLARKVLLQHQVLPCKAEGTTILLDASAAIMTCIF